MSNKFGELERFEDEALINLLGQRVIVMFTETFQKLTSSIQDSLGNEAKGILFDSGIYAGKNSVKILLQAWEERGEDFIKKWAQFYGSKGVGWFHVEYIEIDIENGTGYIKINQSFALKKDSLSNETSSNSPCCDFLSGFFIGVFEGMTGKKIECQEENHYSKDHPFCEFKLTQY